MNKKTIIRKVGCILMMLALSSSFAFASSSKTTIQKEYTFLTTSNTYNYTKNQTITVDGTKYKVDKIDYELIKDIDNTITKNILNLTEKKVDQTITVDGMKYELVSEPTYTEREVEESVTYENYDDATYPSTYDIIINNEDGDVKVTGKVSDSVKSFTESYTKPFSSQARFYGKSDVLYYLLDGQKVPNNVTTPTFTGYENTVLQYLNLNPQLYKITGATWTTDYYNLNGEVVRDAVFTGMRRSNNYEVTYTATVYDADATYSNGNKGDKSHLVKAIVDYKKAGLTTMQIIGIVGGGILIIALASAIILYILSKKKKTSTSEE